MNRDRTRTEAMLMFAVALIEMGLIVAVGYFLFSWVARVIAQVIA